MDFGLSPTKKTDKLKSAIVPNTIVGRLENGSDWLLHRYDIEEVLSERASKEKLYSDYIKKNSLKL